MYYTIGFLLLVLTLCEFLFKNTKEIRSVFFVVAGIIFFILLGFNRWSPDLEFYQRHFENYDQEFIRISVEPVHLFLMELANSLNLKFEDYQLALSAIIFILLFSSVYRYSPIPIFVLFNLYFLPFFPDIVQIRSFLSVSLVIFSLQFFEKKKKYFYLILLIAILSHYSTLCILFFLLLRRFDFFHNRKRTNMIVGVGVLLLLAIPKAIAEPIVAAVNPKYVLLLNANTTFLGTILLFLPFFVFNNIVLAIHEKYSPIWEEENVMPRYLPIMAELIRFSNYLILFQYFIRDFSRWTMNIHILSIIYISVLSSFEIKRSFNASKILSLKIIAVIFTLIAFYVNFLMVNSGEYLEIIFKTFTSNPFLS